MHVPCSKEPEERQGKTCGRITKSFYTDSLCLFQFFIPVYSFSSHNGQFLILMSIPGISSAISPARTPSKPFDAARDSAAIP